MTKTSKTLLILSAIGFLSGLAFVAGFVNVSNATALYVALPAGAIFLGLFLLSKILEKESALYDREREAILARIRDQEKQSSRPAPVREPADTLRSI